MSRFILGNCIDVMRGFPDRAVDLIVTDPPYLVGFKDRQCRQIAGDVTDEWLQPACNEMYRVLKKDALMVSFYGWNRVDRFMSAWKEWLQPACNEMYRVLKKDALMVSFYGWNRVDRFMSAWKNAGFSVVGHLVFTKNYTSKAAYVGYRHECAWKNAGFSVVGHLVFTKTYTSKAAYVGYRHECAYILAKGRPRLPQNPRKRPSTSATKPAAGRAGLEIFGQSSSPDGKARYQPATAD